MKTARKLTTADLAYIAAQYKIAADHTAKAETYEAKQAEAAKAGSDYAEIFAEFAARERAQAEAHTTIARLHEGKL